MSYHVNAILNPLPRLGARSVGMAGFGAVGLGAVPDPGLVNAIVSVARQNPSYNDGQVIFVAVAGTPGLSPAQVQSVPATLLTKIVAKARQSPMLSGAQVLAAVTPRPVVIQESTLASSAAAIARRAGPSAGAFFSSCMTDPIGARNTIACDSAAEKQVGTLQGDQLSLYNQCMAQKAADIPVMVQHGPCYTQAKALSSGGGAPPPGADAIPYTPPPDAATPADGGGLFSNKWVWVGAAVAVAGLGWVLLKKPKQASSPGAS